MRFSHLHLHSHYSLLDGMSTVEDIVERTKELGMSSVALTDHGVMYGAVEFYEQAKKAGIHPVVGCELYLASRTMYDKDPQKDSEIYHLLLLAENNVGYKNLMRLVTKAHLEGFYYKPRVDKNLLRELKEGLIVTSGCLQGEISRAIMQRNKDKARTLTREYLDIFGKDHFYFEAQHHPEIPDQQFLNAGVKELAREFNVPTILTCDSHYPKPEDRDAHDVFLSIQTKTTVDNKERMSMKEADFSIKDPALVWNDVKDDPELAQAFENTELLAQRCDAQIEIGKPAFPKFPVPEGMTPESYLRGLAHQGARQKYGQMAPETSKRLEYELDIICNMGFADYFLIVHDFVNWARSQGIMIGPRGSAAGSVVLYVLDITDLDPIKYDLIFERFLNPERKMLPDIDMDVAEDHRQELIKYIEEKYGKDHVAQIVTFGVMKARLAVRDVARALGLPYALGDQISKLIPFNVTLDDALATIPELKDLYNSNPDAKTVMDYARRLEGIVRHASTHAAGVVIAPGPLSDFAPVQYAARGDENTCIQYDFHAAEDIGLVKMDVLGLANLTVIKNAMRIVRKIYNPEFDVDTIPDGDPAVFSLLSRAETIGVFQLESSGMQRYLKELKPTTFEDILSMIALYRPGPMESIPDFIAAKHGRKQVTYLHPLLEPILAKTYGVIVTQDQVLEIARRFAGFTYGEADILRKAVGKKIKALLDEQKDKFVQGAVKTHGMKQALAEKVWDFIEPFARYGFNRAHAARYARIAYQTAYLKAHYTPAFMAALLTSDFGNLDRIAIEISECQRMGMKIVPPHVNKSFAEFGVDPESKNIVFSLSAIKGVGVGVAEAIQEERKQNGPFTSLTNFVERVPKNVVNKKTVECLAKVGALDTFGERAQILAAIDQITKFSASLDKQQGANQMGLFGGVSGVPMKSTIKLPQVPPATKKDRMTWEKEFLGLYLSDNPLSEHSGTLAQLATPIARVNESMVGKRLRIGGVIASCRRIVTKTGHAMLFTRLEDTSNRNMEVVVFPSTLEQNPGIWQEDRVVLVEGRINARDGELKMVCDSVRPIESI